MSGGCQSFELRIRVGVEWVGSLEHSVRRSRPSLKQIPPRNTKSERGKGSLVFLLGFRGSQEAYRL